MVPNCYRRAQHSDLALMSTRSYASTYDTHGHERRLSKYRVSDEELFRSVAQFCRDLLVSDLRLQLCPARGVSLRLFPIEFDYLMCLDI